LNHNLFQQAVGSVTWCLLVPASAKPQPSLPLNHSKEALGLRCGWIVGECVPVPGSKALGAPKPIASSHCAGTLHLASCPIHRNLFFCVECTLSLALPNGLSRYCLMRRESAPSSGSTGIDCRTSGRVQLVKPRVDIEFMSVALAIACDREQLLSLWLRLSEHACRHFVWRAKCDNYLISQSER
jgi:hypothetical protein